MNNELIEKVNKYLRKYKCDSKYYEELKNTYKELVNNKELSNNPTYNDYVIELCFLLENSYNSKTNKVYVFILILIVLFLSTFVVIINKNNINDDISDLANAKTIIRLDSDINIGHIVSDNNGYNRTKFGFNVTSDKADKIRYYVYVTLREEMDIEGIMFTVENNGNEIQGTLSKCSKIGNKYLIYMGYSNVEEQNLLYINLFKNGSIENDEKYIISIDGIAIKN